MGHPMRIELTRAGLLVYLANHYTTEVPLYVNKVGYFLFLKLSSIIKTQSGHTRVFDKTNLYSMTTILLIDLFFFFLKYFSSLSLNLSHLSSFLLS